MSTFSFQSFPKSLHCPIFTNFSFFFPFLNFLLGSFFFIYFLMHINIWPIQNDKKQKNRITVIQRITLYEWILGPQVLVCCPTCFSEWIINKWITSLKHHRYLLNQTETRYATSSVEIIFIQIIRSGLSYPYSICAISNTCVIWIYQITYHTSHRDQCLNQEYSNI